MDELRKKIYNRAFGAIVVILVLGILTMGYFAHTGSLKPKQGELYPIQYAMPFYRVELNPFDTERFSEGSEEEFFAQMTLVVCMEYFNSCHLVNNGQYVNVYRRLYVASDGKPYYLYYVKQSEIVLPQYYED